MIKARGRLYDEILIFRLRIRYETNGYDNGIDIFLAQFKKTSLTPSHQCKS